MEYLIMVDYYKVPGRDKDGGLRIMLCFQHPVHFPSMLDDGGWIAALIREVELDEMPRSASRIGLICGFIILVDKEKKRKE
jgi:hypothetical protein